MEQTDLDLKKANLKIQALLERVAQVSDEATDYRANFTLLAEENQRLREQIEELENIQNAEDGEDVSPEADTDDTDK